MDSLCSQYVVHSYTPMGNNIHTVQHSGYYFCSQILKFIEKNTQKSYYSVSKALKKLLPVFIWTQKLYQQYNILVRLYTELVS